MKINFEIDEKTLKKLIQEHFEEKTGQMIPEDKIVIKVKSKQNYRSEWEIAAFKATFQGEI